MTGRLCCTAKSNDMKLMTGYIFRWRFIERAWTAVSQLQKKREGSGRKRKEKPAPRCSANSSLRIIVLRQVKTRVNKNLCRRNVVWTRFARSSEVRLDRNKWLQRISTKMSRSQVKPNGDKHCVF